MNWKVKFWKWCGNHASTIRHMKNLVFVIAVSIGLVLYWSGSDPFSSIIGFGITGWLLESVLGMILIHLGED